jgi:hypothetical protein
MEEDIFASLCNMKWDFEEFKKNSKQNYTFVTYGADNPMFGLKGENHPSHLWHKKEATKEYYEQKRKSVLESWMNDDERRKQHSKKMKERWQSGKITPETARKNGQHGLKGKQIHNTLDIEYKGVLYYGWRELQDKTKVTKHLYKKYYLNGINPEPRIGCNGPNTNINMNKIEKEVSV